MTRPRRSDRCVPAVLGAALCLWFASPAAAQAWLPPRGELTVTLGWTNTNAKDHFDPEGERFNPVPAGVTPVPATGNNTYVDTFVLDLSYGITDRLALRLGLPPLMLSRYSGPRPHPTVSDDGDWHATFTDFRPELRFMAVSEPFVLTPFVGGTIPSHDYEFLGHAAPGKDIWEVRAGVYAGRRLDPVLPDAYVQVRYQYTWAERILDVYHDSSNINLDLGYFATPSLTVRGLGNWLVGHGGVDPTRVPRNTELWAHHDQVGNDHVFNAGCALSYSVTADVDVNAAFYKSLSGRNGHALEHGISVWLNFNASPARFFRKSSAEGKGAGGADQQL